jgi:hypothetical protein
LTTVIVTTLRRATQGYSRVTQGLRKGYAKATQGLRKGYARATQRLRKGYARAIEIFLHFVARCHFFLTHSAALLILMTAKCIIFSRRYSTLRDARATQGLHMGYVRATQGLRKGCARATQG